MESSVFALSSETHSSSFPIYISFNIGLLTGIAYHTRSVCLVESDSSDNESIFALESFFHVLIKVSLL